MMKNLHLDYGRGPECQPLLPPGLPRPLAASPVAPETRLTHDQEVPTICLAGAPPRRP
jgi:hypothetical protein